jgi:predicted metal-dependent HD superfamily phosphohydrolase
MAFKDVLSAAWVSVFPGLKRHFADPFVENLFARYSEAPRRYHNVEHVSDVVALALSCSTPVRSRANVVFALLYHDVIYDPTKKSNEADSADLAIDVIDKVRALGYRGETPEPAEIKRLIMLTCHNALAPDPSSDSDGAVVVDCDLSILGAPPDRFMRYDNDIRSEYQHVDDDAFICGRTHVLTSLLERPQLYATEEFRDKFELQARSNLRAAIGNLIKLRRSVSSCGGAAALHQPIETGQVESPGSSGQAENCTASAAPGRMA